MPHVIYLHSALTQRRIVGVTEVEKRKIFRFERWDVIIAMSIAGLINISMLTIAAAAFYHQDLGPIQSLGKRFTPSARGSDTVRTSSSGSAFSPPGCRPRQSHPVRAGGHAGVHPPPNPALPAAGDHDGARADSDRRRARPVSLLVLSQVVLSFGIPFALIPLLLFCRDKGLMGNAGQPNA